MKPHCHRWSGFGPFSYCVQCDKPRGNRFEMKSTPVRLAKSRLPAIGRFGEVLARGEKK